MDNTVESATVDETAVVTRKSQSLPNVAFAIIAFLGVLLASYPAISQWVSAYQQAGQVTGYTESLERVSSDVLEDVLSVAHQYNQSMPGVLVSDPYSLDDAREGESGAWENYLEALKVPDSDVMATIRIPGIDVNLPVRHGTSDEVLAAGAGHLFGSSLPVGGESTHSVITAHTAFSRAQLFDDLDQVEQGDKFFIDVAGETLTYKVDSIEVVLPHEVEALSLETGRDLVTLVTCAPPTVNTHRLLVRGERIDLEGLSGEGQAENRDGTSAGFPWWMLWVGAAGTGLTVFVLRGNKSRQAEASPSDAENSGPSAA